MGIEGFIVCKFGGSSLSDADAFRRVKKILRSDGRRKTVVVSAPGKRFDGDEKVTDVLFALYKRGNADRSFFYKSFSRYFAICQDLNLKLDIGAEVKRIYDEFHLGKDYVVSRGEYLSALIAAEYFGFTFIDAKDVFFFDNGVIGGLKTKNAVKAIDFSRGVVVPGFYGRDDKGGIRLFKRGGSDVSGAYLAAYSGAAVYENWKDVSGVYEKDPKIFCGQKPLASMTYRKLENLLSSGAKVLDIGAIAPLIEYGVTLKILNSFDPSGGGTTVTKNGS
ncbi:MAG: hypothetical protein ILP02_04505 [Clostridia bacterium]|nr:hypothetical protein [Clostridia bacterium]